MTSLAFIFGILPLAIAEGAGANSRHSLGTTVMGGMIVSTILSLYVVPVLYLVFKSIKDRFRKKSVEPKGPNDPKAPPLGADDTHKDSLLKL